MRYSQFLVQSRTRGNKTLIGLLIFVLILSFFFSHFRLHKDSSNSLNDVNSVEQLSREVDLVVASLSTENSAWVDKFLPQSWTKRVYVVDDSSAELQAPQNKGREAMVYLTYIIDYYDNLPDNVVFMHASRFAWHNDEPDYDALPILRNLQLGYLQEVGYLNLRCVWVIGCPAEIRPIQDEANAPSAKKIYAKHTYRKAFDELFPEIPMPDLVSVSCCSQFGVTKDAIRRRRKDDYIRYRRWLLDTTLPDNLSGRVFEFSWHMMFGKEPVHCPSASECYCKVFGLCQLECSDESSCEGRYTLPRVSTMPVGWPKKGWHGEDRDFFGPL
ncbi:hypothetical protein F5Y16DRAFT_364998 [Xylariaceae sp. FL0255]|nr:hypothetical protein F5Y16DRAFT_364998 [Xylariaceae sp. FL0255]